MESWKVIEGYDGRYEVSDLGRVKSTAYTYTRRRQGQQTTRQAQTSEKILKPGVKRYGYLAVYLTVPGHSKGVSKAVAGLVCEAFLGKRPKDKEVAHINGNSSDNRLANLMWATKAENGQHRRDHGTSAKFCRKLKAEIMARRDAGEKGCDLARLYGINPQSITRWRSERKEL